MNRFLQIFVFVMAGSIAGFATTASGSALEDSDRLVIHLLDYLAKDYGVAVKNGKVIDQLEYDEQVEFIDMAKETSLENPLLESNLNIQKKIIRLEELIVNKASVKDVARLARQIQSEVIKLSGLNIAPAKWPNLVNGKRLYLQSCKNCHGISGNGKGPKVHDKMIPKPTNFLDRAAMKEISPFQAFNTTRLGVFGTAMPQNDSISDSEVWDLAFYIVSLRHEDALDGNGLTGFKRAQDFFGEDLLSKVATSSDRQLGNLLNKQVKVDEILTAVAASSDRQLESLLNNQVKADEMLTALRTYSMADGTENFPDIARRHLNNSAEAFEKGDFKLAKAEAIRAYLNGIEPIEPWLKANDRETFNEIELRMNMVRSAIEKQKPFNEVSASIQAARLTINKAESLLEGEELSPLLAFLAASAILLREGFEAVLIIFALLSVIRAAESKQAEKWLHGGWILALVFGGFAWLFSGWLMSFSGLHRELMEAVTTLFAVCVLLYAGFWLHRQTQLKRWGLFIDGKIKTMLNGKNLVGLAVISFIAVFREAFETVLFLRVIWMEGGESSRAAMVSGVWVSLFTIIGLAWLALKYSLRIPVKKLFRLTSWIMAVLATVLTGKGLHSLQETGLLSITGTPINIRLDILGLYPTLETLVPQVTVFVIVVLIWNMGNKSASGASAVKTT
jgi:high-affinity iron transporter